MSPGDLQHLTDAIKDIGTLGLAILAVWAFYTRRVVPRSERDALVVEWEKRYAEREVDYTAKTRQIVDYVEQRRQEERQGRLEAEHRLADAVDGMDTLTQLLNAVKDEVIRGAPRRA